MIERRTRSPANFRALTTPAARLPEMEEAALWVEDAKLFAAGWVGGLVVFGTLFA